MMRFFLIILFFALKQTIAVGQTDTAVFTVVEHMPQFPGGPTAMSEFINTHVEYPSDTSNCLMSFTVYVTFIVEQNGKIINASILANKGGNAAFGKEAVRVVKSMPLWSPGMQNEHPARVQLSVPIRFTLVQEERVFTKVEKMSSFPGGRMEMLNFIEQNMKYPQKAKSEGRSGSCYVQAVIEKDGSITNLKLLRTIEGSTDLNEEAIRIVKMMPKWEPGTQNGKAVRTQAVIIVNFR